MNKHFLFSFVLFAFVFNCNLLSYSQNVKEDNFEKVKEYIQEMKQSIKEEMYFNTYEMLEHSLRIVEDQEQLELILEIIKDLKSKCPVKPKSICECLEAKMKKGEKIEPEILFWNKCPELIKEK
ncbi:MAG TPA: hypothetical protein PLW77_06745 [Bacteroidales bacterium]|nr:hypothetical protein [Bacteroidales bacterium]HQB22634.1 hypothetical protein [Bacteroidales bacterium]